MPSLFFPGDWQLTEAVYFLYPETCGVRLEDMDALFGDATRATGTPAVGTPAIGPENETLIRSGSPVPPLDIQGRPRLGAATALPGLNIDPPTEVDSDAKRTAPRNRGGGIGGWLSWVMGRRPGEPSSEEYESVRQTVD